MTSRKIRNAFAPCLTAVLALSCVNVQEPSAPDITVEGDPSGSSSCECPAEQMIGRAYRFTSLGVIEPYKLAGNLDSMWENELENYILNVIFVVQEASAGSATNAFDSMTLVAGPGWRTPEKPYLISGDADFAITSYRLMEGLQIELEMAPVSGYQCQIKNTEPKSLYFHLGPLDDPLMCGPLLEPPNATPIKDLVIRFGFNEDCSKIENGYLRGCLSPYDVDRICMCQIASECTREGGDPGAAFPGDDDLNQEILTGYCKDACGFADIPGATNWTSFGALMRLMTVDQTCITSDGEAGYLLEGVFSAEEVTELFDPSSIELVAEKAVE